MKLSKAVGKNAHGQLASDVKLVQLALSAIKSCNKRYYKGKIDGKAGPQTICAIEGFQCDNKISVTGKIDTHGTTFNRLRQKTPMAMKNKLTKSGGGGTGAGGTQDQQKINANNKKLADTIKNKWPLPNKEAAELAASVVAVATEGMVPLKAKGAHPVTIDNAGRFTVELDIEPWGYSRNTDGDKVRLAMIKRVNKIIAGKGKWHSGNADTLIFKSAIANPFVKGGERPSDEFLKLMNYRRDSQAHLLMAWLAALEKHYKKMYIMENPNVPQSFKELGERILAPHNLTTQSVISQIKKLIKAQNERRMKALLFMKTKIIPALHTYGVENMDAAVLLLGTAITESKLELRVQTTGGPARGLFQIELPWQGNHGTHIDNWVIFLNDDKPVAKKMRERVLETIPNWQTKVYPNAKKLNFEYHPETDFKKLLPLLEEELEHNDKYATLMAYIWYRRRIGLNFPSPNSVSAMASVWSQHYNTTQPVQKFINDWKYVMGEYKFP